MTQIKEFGFQSSYVANPTLTQFERDLIKALLNLETNLKGILNRGINFRENIDCATVDFTSSATPNAENTVAHTLGKIPTGYIVVGKDKAGDLYNGTSAWTGSNVFLKCSVASVTLKIIVF